jgi:hypothetical protein
MQLRIVHTFTPGATSESVHIEPDDCLLLRFKPPFGQYSCYTPATEVVSIGERRARIYAWTYDWSATPGWFYSTWCYLQIDRFTAGVHEIKFQPTDGSTLELGYVVRGASGGGGRDRDYGTIGQSEHIDLYDPEYNYFYTQFPYRISSEDRPFDDKLILTLAGIMGTQGLFIPPIFRGSSSLPIELNQPPPYGEEISPGYFLQIVRGGYELPPPWPPGGYTYTPHEPPTVTTSITASTGAVIHWFYGNGDDHWDWYQGTNERDITGITQLGMYLECVPADDDDSGPNATGMTQVGGYIEAITEGSADATGVTQIGSYLEATSTDGPSATGITQIGAYLETTSSDGVDATGVTQIGAYIEAVVDPTYSATLIRISQAFTLVEARRVIVRVSQAFTLVEARRVPALPLPPPASGDIPSRLPEYQQALPVPFNPLDLPKVATPSVEMPLLPPKGPAPFGPIQWISMPEAPPVSMPPLPESEPAQPYDLPSRGRADILGITKARIARSILVDALAATFDAQSIPVKGAAIGPNLALVNGVPAQTTETSPIAGRTATYTNIGRASMAIYAPEVQTPAAQKVNSATDATPTIVLPPASPTTRINVIYPLLGSGSLASDLTLALDEIGYRATIAAVLDAIMQSTVTIGYEEGAAPGAINLYVMPGAIDAATLDGLTVSELYLAGNAEGQILRYNETAGQWRPASEPLDFKGLNLATDETPEQHGGFRYNPLTKHLEMLVEVA